jgi:transposase
MKKNSTKRQMKKVAAEFAALKERAEGSLVIGIDVGDKQSHYCVRTVGAEVVCEGTVETKPDRIYVWLQELKRQRIVFETGTHSRWMAELLGAMGHEVIVGNARKLKLVTENTHKSDKVDARQLSKLGTVGTEFLFPVYQRRKEAQVDLMMVRSRDLLVQVRTTMINHVRGMVKSYGVRLSDCSAEAFAGVAGREMPESLRRALSGTLEALEAVNEQIHRYTCEVEHACETRYAEQTRWLLQVKGVGPVTALTFVLVIDDEGRFEDSRDVGDYLGLATKRRQSGKSDPQLGIGKDGDEMLRRYLVNCGHHILGVYGEDSDVRRWGLNLLERGRQAGKKGARKRAVAAVARKLAVLLHVLWKKRRVYEPLRVAGMKAAAQPAA